MIEHIPVDHVIPCAYGHGLPVKERGYYTCCGLSEGIEAENCPNQKVRVPTLAEWNALQLSHFESKSSILAQVLNILQHSANVTSRNELVKATYTAAISVVRKLRKQVTLDIYDPNAIQPELVEGDNADGKEPGQTLSQEAIQGTGGTEPSKEAQEPETEEQEASVIGDGEDSEEAETFDSDE